MPKKKKKKAFAVNLWIRLLQSYLKQKSNVQKCILYCLRYIRMNYRIWVLFIFYNSLRTLKNKLKSSHLFLCLWFCCWGVWGFCLCFFSLNFIKPEYESRSLQQSKGLVQQKTTPQPPGMEPHQACRFTLWFRSWLCMNNAVQKLWSQKRYPPRGDLLRGHLCTQFGDQSPLVPAGQHQLLVCSAERGHQGRTSQSYPGSDHWYHLASVECWNLVLLPYEMVSSSTLGSFDLRF